MLQSKWHYKYEEFDRLFSGSWNLQWPDPYTVSLTTLDRLTIFIPVSKPDSTHVLFLEGRLELSIEELRNIIHTAKFGKPPEFNDLDAYNETVDEFVSYPENGIEPTEEQFEDFNEIPSVKYLPAPNLRLFNDKRKWEYRTKIIGKGKRSNIYFLDLNWGLFKGEPICAMLLSNNYVFFATLPSKTATQSGGSADRVLTNTKVMNYFSGTPLCLALQRNQSGEEGFIAVGTKQGILVSKVKEDKDREEINCRIAGKFLDSKVKKVTAISWLNERFLVAGDADGVLSLLSVEKDTEQTVSISNLFQIDLGVDLDVERILLEKNKLYVCCGDSITMVGFSLDDKADSPLLLERRILLEYQPAGVVFNSSLGIVVVLDGFGKYYYYDSSLRELEECPVFAVTKNTYTEKLYDEEKDEMFEDDTAYSKTPQAGLAISPNDQFVLSVSTTLDLDEIKLRAVANKYVTFSIVPFKNAGDQKTPYLFDIALHRIFEDCVGSKILKESTEEEFYAPDVVRERKQIIASNLSLMGGDHVEKMANKILRTIDDFYASPRKLKTKYTRNPETKASLANHADLAYLFVFEHKSILSEEISRRLYELCRKVCTSVSQPQLPLSVRKEVTSKEKMFDEDAYVQVSRTNPLGLRAQVHGVTFSRCACTLLLIGSAPVIALNPLFCPWCGTQYLDYSKMKFFGLLYGRSECIFCDIPLFNASMEKRH
eukprot:snap_masked-scaffold_5-processed-gene-9.12-mRNA-1 protein AED:1.00 eAED:1.00 QI:0/-1/0/0/-1/1/1/0/710